MDKGAAGEDPCEAVAMRGPRAVRGVLAAAWLAATPGRAAAAGEEAATSAAPAPAAAEEATGWGRCAPGTSPCVRPQPARWALAVGGLVAAVAGAAHLMVIGDRVGAGDPGALIGGVGVAALGGAVLGGLYAMLGGDRPNDPDRLRPATIEMAYSTGGAPVLDERHPGTGVLRFAPNYFFPGGGGRLRVFGQVGGALGREVEVDPRPQFMDPIPGQEGTAPVVLAERRLRVGFGADLAVALPYPALRRSAHLGAAELRWRPEVQVRRHFYDGRQIERTMVLPLTIGARWLLAPRQRFTVYFGPRFDVIGAAGEGERLARGGANVAALFGEAWYDYDVPFGWTARGRVRVNGQLTVGYVHSRFDGMGVNVVGIRGFLGPVWAGWAMRARPRGAKVAVQGGVGAWIGNGFTGVFNLGVVLPDLGGQIP